MRLSTINITSPLVLAPLAGYTDSPFRRICRKRGAGMVFTELVSSQGIVRKNEKTMELMRFHPDEHPIGIQLFGEEAGVMADAAGITAELKPDCIDINMGCPMPKVCGDGTRSGAALLKSTGLIYDVTHAVRKAVDLPVSAKIRIGWDMTSLNYLEVLAALEEAGVDFITVHGRTRSQKYTGKANWDIISEIAEKATVPVIGNGDIDSFKEAQERLKSSGCSAVMIGRASVGNPWIFSNEKPDYQARINQIIEHMDYMLEKYGSHGLVMMRKHFAKYIQNIRNAAHYRSKLMITKDRNEVLEILNSIKQGDEIS